MGPFRSRSPVTARSWEHGTGGVCRGHCDSSQRPLPCPRSRPQDPGFPPAWLGKGLHGLLAPLAGTPPPDPTDDGSGAQEGEADEMSLDADNL